MINERSCSRRVGQVKRSTRIRADAQRAFITNPRETVCRRVRYAREDSESRVVTTQAISLTHEASNAEKRDDERAR